MIPRRSPRLAMKYSGHRRKSKTLSFSPRRSPRIAAKNQSILNQRTPKYNKRNNCWIPSTPVKKTRRSQLSSKISIHAPLGVVDPASKINGSIHIMEGNVSCDVMLALVDPARRMDKFFILQLINLDDKESCVVYTRWGRTGSTGQALEQHFNDLENAMDCFKQKFEQKTALSWKFRHLLPTPGKYRFIQQDFIQKARGYKEGKWQYWVDDGVDGKSTNWYDYTVEGSYNVEELYHLHVQNRNCHRRIVASGGWTYDVDLNKMTQTNATHSNHTIRKIRRITAYIDK